MTEKDPQIPSSALVKKQPDKLDKRELKKEKNTTRVTLDDLLKHPNYAGIGSVPDCEPMDDYYFNKLIEGAGDIGEAVDSDPRIEELVRETENTEHFMVAIRKSEIALNYLLPIVEQLPSLRHLDDRFSEEGEWIGRKINIVYAAMFLATGSGYKCWEIDARELAAMEGTDKVALIKKTFDSHKLKCTTLYERQTGRFTFETYRANSGEMDENSYRAAVGFNPSEEEKGKARKKLEVAIKEMPAVGKHIKELNNKIIVAAARIIHVYGAKKPNNWILAETLVFIGRA